MDKFRFSTRIALKNYFVHKKVTPSQSYACKYIVRKAASIHHVSYSTTVDLSDSKCTQLRRCINKWINHLVATLEPQSSGPSYNSTVIGTLAVDEWAVTFGTARRGLGGLRPRAVPS